MTQKKVHIQSISQLHNLLGFDKPKHPLISYIDASQLTIPEGDIGAEVVLDFYMISLKDKSCGLEYGRNSFDFDEGVMVFSAPGQIYSPTKQVSQGDITGWMLYFHPDLIRNTHLALQMEEYGFFNYEVFEALHLSAEEEQIMHNSAENIRNEYNQRIDNHSQRVIVSQLELMLNYSLRYYERQFNTREAQSKDIVVQFQKDLRHYYENDLQQTEGSPSIQWFAARAHLSKHYFSDLIKKETGRTPKDHINGYIVEKAKQILLSSHHSVSEIAYDLGFNYPHYFTRLFKNKTGLTPMEFRHMN